MKKVLFVATITAHIKGFHIPYLQLFKENGYEVHVASNGNEEIQNCDKHYNIEFARNPINIENIKAYLSLKKIIKKNNYEIIHCHTPVGGALTRLAVKRNSNTKVIYTAHGFHFYKGAPIKNWMIYYPIEKYLSKYTDKLITINEEDYKLANRKFKTQTILVNGVGVDENKFNIEIDRAKIQRQLGINKDDYIFLSIGELNKNKNQIVQIEAMKIIVRKYKNIKLLIAGKGSLKDYYEKIINENELKDNVKLIGYRKDIIKILKYCDCVISTSKREGLPINIIEAMFAEKEIIASQIRGHQDLLPHQKLFHLNNIDELVQKMKIAYIKNNKSIKYDIEKYKLKNIEEKMYEIYMKGNIK